MGALKLTTRFFMAALRWRVRHDQGAFQSEGFAASWWVCLHIEVAKNRCGNRGHADDPFPLIE